MKKGLLTYILLLTLSGLQAQTPTPRLVVSLTIDQLRSDYLENFAALYGEQGFKRLMRDGRFYTQTQFDFNKPDRASAMASVYTGTTPSVHGIIGEKWLDTSTLNVKNCVDDTNYIGNYTNESSSAMQMLTTTVTDELKIQTGGKALVYAIAPFRDAAILSAGHAADCALWLNESTGKWCSTTYYSEFPAWLSQYNEQRSPAYTLKNQSWTPTLTPGQYVYLSNTQEAAFKYTPSEDKVNLYRLYCTTPLVNDEINKLTEELLNNHPIGYDLTPDFLSLTYYAGGYNHQAGTDHALEIQDAYLRLDQSIAQLLSLLDRKVGMQNILFCVSSTGYNDLDALEPKRYRIPSGEFYLNRCAALLNVYLMATYGEGQYIEAYNDQQIYLNHKLIEEKQINLSDIEEKASEFLAQFSGVQQVFTANKLLVGAGNTSWERTRNGFYAERSGDLLLDILPGWTIVDEKDATKNTVVNKAQVPTPYIILGTGIKPAIVRTPVSAKCIAPTLAGALHIRAPNASEAFSLDF